MTDTDVKDVAAAAASPKDAPAVDEHFDEIKQAKLEKAYAEHPDIPQHLIRETMEQAEKAEAAKAKMPPRTESMTIERHGVRIPWSEFVKVMNKLEGVSLPEEVADFRLHQAKQPDGTDGIEATYSVPGDRYADGVIVTD